MDIMTVQRNITESIKGYFWCPGIHERKIIIIFGFFINVVLIPKYVIANVNIYFKFPIILCY